jgi:heme-degrading monooxygenase HmoA
MIKMVMEHRTKDMESAKLLVKTFKKIQQVVVKQPGFISTNILLGAEDPCHVLIIDTWETEQDWKTWDESAVRAETKPDLEELLTQPFNALLLNDDVVWREDLVNSR